MLIEGPTWIGIGAQRCGTTWFTDLLVQHPLMDVAGAKKEHHLLYQYGLTREWSPTAREEYREAFTSDELRLGEYTPYYMRASWICELAADALPESSPILVLVRDPIDRFASALRHEMQLAAGRYRRQMKAVSREEGHAGVGSVEQRQPVPRLRSGRSRRRALLGRVVRATGMWWDQGPPQAPPEAFQDRSWLRFVGSDASWGGMYAAQLDAWTAALPAERFIVIQFEKLRQNPQQYTNLVWRRLGLDPVPLAGIDQRSSSSTESEQWLPEDHPHMVRALQRIYRPDAHRLATRFDIDLNLWKRTMTDA